MSDASTAPASPLRPGSRRFALGLFIVALLQTAVPGWMIYDRISLLDSGREIVLDVVPFDPRSLFRGDYVILTYPVSRLDLEALEGDDEFERGETVFVTLRRDGAASWRAESVWKTYPSGAGAEKVVLRGTARPAGTELRVEYGIGSYFVPEGEGRALERQVRAQTLQVLAAVAPDGEAAIKGLLIDGELRYEEPLF